MYEWILVNIIVFAAAALQAITGSGFAIAATPFLLLVIVSRESILISSFLSFFIAVVMVPRIRHHVCVSLFKRLVIGSIAGAPLGLWLFVSLPIDTIKLIVAVVVLKVSVFAIWRWFYPAGNGSEQTSSSHIKWLELATGLAAGVLTVSIGMPGVPLAMYFVQGHFMKEQVRSTTLSFFVVIYIVSMALQALAGQITMETVRFSATLVPATLCGIAAGMKMFGRINQRMFQMLINLILLYTGLHILGSHLLR